MGTISFIQEQLKRLIKPPPIFTTRIVIRLCAYMDSNPNSNAL